MFKFYFLIDSIKKLTVMIKDKVFLLAIILLLTTEVAYSAELPGGATPGGVLPQFMDEPEPFVYPEIKEQELPVESPVIDDAASPRMLLKGFDIQGVKEHPEHDITLKNIQNLIAAETAAMIPEGQPRLFTIGMYERIAIAVTRYYRERGYFLARAYIPEQKVTNGIVKLIVAEGYLEQIVFDGNQLYDDATMAVLFDDLIGQPVFIDNIELALIRLNDYPGLNASAIFGPGTKPGSAAIMMRTDEVSTYDLISFDNYGSAYTGEYRVLYRHTTNNLFGNADFLTFNLMAGISPTNSQYADIMYAQPIYKSLFKVGGGAKINYFDVGQELADLKIKGESLIVNGFIQHDVVHSKFDKFTLVADISLKSASSTILGSVSSEDKLTVLKLDAIYSGLDRWLWPARHEALASISLGSDFTKFNFSYTRLQPTVSLQSLLFRFQAQQTSDSLTSLEQYSLGGPYNVRAYPVAEVLVDNAVFTSFEYIFSSSPDTQHPWLNNLQISVFFDHASGDINEPLINEVASVTLSGMGVGVQVEPLNNLHARIDMATALGDEPSELQSLPFYFSLQYQF